MSADIISVMKITTVGIYTHDVEYLKDSLFYCDLSRCVFYTTDQKDNFIDSTHDVKIAIVVPNWHKDKIDPVSLQQQLLQFSHCDLVLVCSVEMHKIISEVISNFDRANYKFVVNAVFNYPMYLAEVFHDIAHFYSTAYFYQHERPDIVKNKLIPFAKKLYLFDVMYGMPKPHRTFVKNYIESSLHKNLFYQTPYFDPGAVDNNNSAYNIDNKDLWEDEMEVHPTIEYSCNYFGKQMSISQVLPLKIYNKTCYSLVCETNFSNEFSFFTEKTAKPILAHRLFVVVAGRWYLKNLKSLGFKTFHGIIDESYDDIEDHHQRWNMALAQVDWLCTQDCSSIFKKIIPIAIHNYNVLKNMSSTTLSQVLERELLTRGFHQ